MMQVANKLFKLYNSLALKSKLKIICQHKFLYKLNIDNTAYL